MPHMATKKATFVVQWHLLGGPLHSINTSFVHLLQYIGCVEIAFISLVQRCTVGQTIDLELQFMTLCQTIFSNFLDMQQAVTSKIETQPSKSRLLDVQLTVFYHLDRFCMHTQIHRHGTVQCVFVLCYSQGIIVLHWAHANSICHEV